MSDKPSFFQSMNADTLRAEGLASFDTPDFRGDEYKAYFAGGYFIMGAAPRAAIEAYGERLLQAAQRRGVDLRQYREFAYADADFDGALSAREVGATIFAASLNQSDYLGNITAKFDNRVTLEKLAALSDPDGQWLTRVTTKLIMAANFDKSQRTYTDYATMLDDYREEVQHNPWVKMEIDEAKEVKELSSRKTRQVNLFGGSENKKALKNYKGMTFVDGNFTMPDELKYALVELGGKIEGLNPARGQHPLFKNADINRDGDVQKEEAGAWLMAASMQLSLKDGHVVATFDSKASLKDITEAMSGPKAALNRELARQILVDNFKDDELFETKPYHVEDATLADTEKHFLEVAKKNLAPKKRGRE